MKETSLKKWEIKILKRILGKTTMEEDVWRRLTNKDIIEGTILKDPVLQLIAPENLS